MILHHYGWRVVTDPRLLRFASGTDVANHARVETEGFIGVLTMGRKDARIWFLLEASRGVSLSESMSLEEHYGREIFGCVKLGVVNESVIDNISQLRAAYLGPGH
jgi:hypothetical protein